MNDLLACCYDREHKCVARTRLCNTKTRHESQCITSCLLNFITFYHFRGFILLNGWCTLDKCLGALLLRCVNHVKHIGAIVISLQCCKTNNNLTTFLNSASLRSKTEIKRWSLHHRKTCNPIPLGCKKHLLFKIFISTRVETKLLERSR